MLHSLKSNSMAEVDLVVALKSYVQQLAADIRAEMVEEIGAELAGHFGDVLAVDLFYL